MKKYFFAALLLLGLAVMVGACGTTRKTSCPMAEGIIH
jgi:hypothetical protein